MLMFYRPVATNTPTNEFVENQNKLHRSLFDLYKDVSAPFRLFDHFLDSRTESSDVEEVMNASNAYRVNLAGFKKSEISVTVKPAESKYMISISAESTRKEFERTYKKSFLIPSKFDPDSITSTYEDGLLTISFLEKPKEVQSVREIEIK